MRRCRLVAAGYRPAETVFYGGDSARLLRYQQPFLSTRQVAGTEAVEQELSTTAVPTPYVLVTSEVAAARPPAAGAGAGWSWRWPARGTWRRRFASTGWCRRRCRRPSAHRRGAEEERWNGYG